MLLANVTPVTLCHFIDASPVLKGILVESQNHTCIHRQQQLELTDSYEVLLTGDANFYEFF